LKTGRPGAESAARTSYWIQWGAFLASAAFLWWILFNHQYQYQYVHDYSSRAMPRHFVYSAFWGGQEGTFLLWAFISTTLGLFVLRWRSPMMAPTMAFLNAPNIMLGLVTVMRGPFLIAQQAYTDGVGLNPLLQDYWMTIHPPVLFLGFSSFVVPFAIAGAALWRRDYDGWVKPVMPWVVFSTAVQATGFIMGGVWAYKVLGWGGYWGWDPVENSALLPWLTATAFLHSVIIQEKRGMFKIWNMVLILLSFCLMVLGTFVTRTGVISSVHSFARSSLGIPFLSFVAVVFVGSVGLIISRSDLLKSENKLDSLLSREAMFVLNNFLFMTLTFTVFVGTYYSMFSELLVNEKLTVGPPVYNQLVGPQVALLILLMGVGPLAAWRKSSPEGLGKMLWKPALFAVVVMVGLFVVGLQVIPVLLGFGLIAFTSAITLAEYYRGVRARHKLSGESYLTALNRLFARNRRRYGGYLIHVGVLVMGIGVIGSVNFQQQTQRSLAPGGSMTVGHYTITYDRGLTCNPQFGVSGDCAEWYTERGRDVMVVAGYMTVSQAGQAPVVVAPYREIFLNGSGELTPPGILSTVSEDLYLLYLGEQSGFGTIKAYINPLIQFLWIGGIILVLGTLVAMWPSAAERRPATVPQRAALARSGGR